MEGCSWGLLVRFHFKLHVGVRNGWFSMIDGANIEIAEEVGEDNVCELVGFVMNRQRDWYNLLKFSSDIWRRTVYISNYKFNLPWLSPSFTVPSRTWDTNISTMASRSSRNAPLLLLSFNIFLVVLLAMAEFMSRTLRVSFLRLSLTILFYYRLLNTIRQSDYYLITDDFDSCTSRAWHFTLYNY